MPVARERLGFFAAVGIVVLAVLYVLADGYASAQGPQGGSNASSWGGLSDEDREEARAAVERFTLASYGYEGSDAEEYRRGVEETVTENFWESDGAEAVAGGAEVVRAGGAAAQDGDSISGSGATLVTGLLEWRPSGESSGGVEGVAYRRVEEYPLRRESVDAQELSVVKTDDGSWKVNGAEEAYEPDGAELARLDVPDGGEPEVAAEEREALEEAAEGYVLAAYGYEGEDVEEYRAGVRDAVSGREFFDSPGGERVAAEVEEIEDRAARSYGSSVLATSYEWLDLREVDGNDAEGVAYYGSGSAGLQYTGELVRLTRGEDGLWRVSYGGGRQDVNRDALREIQGGDRSAEEERELFGDDEPAGEGTAAGEAGGTGGDGAAAGEAVRAFTEAYDFEGRRADSYVAGIAPYVTDEYWNSPRGAENLADIEEIEAAGETFVQDAELVAWEPTQVGAEEASGYATRSFTSSVGGEPGSYTIRHELRLVKERGEWLVDYGGDPVE